MPRPPRASAALLALLAAACAPESRRPNALIVTLDTTRADALGTYGAPVPTPNLDRLAAEGTVYLQARTVAPLTLPAHASLLTGLYPPRHGVRDNGGVLSPAARSLAELAGDAGYETAAFVAAVVLDRATGVDQGFSTWDQPERPDFSTSPLYAERPAVAVTNAFDAWLEHRQGGRPFLAWVHYFDPHFPYEPDPADLAAARGSAYHGEVAAVDRAVGSVLAALERAGEAEHTVIVVVGDHGESFGEHGETSHSAYCYDGVLRVPLILVRPDRVGRGLRSQELVSVVDVLPTLAEALGLPRPPTADGRSLWSEPVPADRGLYFESLYGYLHYGWSPLVGWMDAGGKYLHSSQPELLDPRSDPTESHALPLDGERQARYEARLRELLARPALEAADPAEGSRLGDLARLGYAGGSATPGEGFDPLTPSDRPAPSTRAEELGLLNDAQVAAATGRFEEAAAGLERIVAENPLHRTALFELGQVYVRLERFGEAIEPLRRAIELGNDWYGPRYQLGVALAGVGRRAEAVRELEQALEQNPALTPARARLRELE